MAVQVFVSDEGTVVPVNKIFYLNPVKESKWSKPKDDGEKGKAEEGVRWYFTVGSVYNTFKSVYYYTEQEALDAWGEIFNAITRE